MSLGSSIAGGLGAASGIASGITSGKGAKKAAEIMAQQEEANRQLYKDMVNKYTTYVDPYQQAGTGATTAMENLLGLNGADASGAQQKAFNTFQNSDGYQYNLNNALGSTNSNAYASGLGNSGATMKALQNNAANLADTYFNNYYSDLSGLSNTGLQATQSLGSMMSNGANGQAAANTAEGEAQSSGILGSNSALFTGLNNALSSLSKATGALDNSTGSSYNSNNESDASIAAENSAGW